jgi:hypothetical protein
MHFRGGLKNGSPQYSGDMMAEEQQNQDISKGSGKDTSAAT